MNGAFLFPAPSRNTHVGQKELMRGGVGGWGVQVCLRMYRTYVCLRTCRSANSFIYTSMRRLWRTLHGAKEAIASGCQALCTLCHSLSLDELTVDTCPEVAGFCATHTQLSTPFSQANGKDLE